MSGQEVQQRRGIKTEKCKALLDNFWITGWWG
jgi:hypothetical protein